MKHYKWRSLLWLMMCVVALSFVACGGDDGDDNSGSNPTGKSIYGTWSVLHTKGAAYNNNTLIDSWDENIDVYSDGYQEIILNTDGTGVIYEWYGIGTSYDQVYYVTFMLTDNNSVISLYNGYGNGIGHWRIQFIDDNTVVLSDREFASASGSYIEYRENTYVRGSRR